MHRIDHWEPSAVASAWLIVGWKGKKEDSMVGTALHHEFRGALRSLAFRDVYHPLEVPGRN